VWSTYYIITVIDCIFLTITPHNIMARPELFLNRSDLVMKGITKIVKCLRIHRPNQVNLPVEVLRLKNMSWQCEVVIQENGLPTGKIIYLHLSESFTKLLEVAERSVLQFHIGPDVISEALSSARRSSFCN
jgi:hypothetical protein